MSDGNENRVLCYINMKNRDIVVAEIIVADLMYIQYNKVATIWQVPLGKGIFLLFTEEVTQWNVWKVLYVVV